MCPRSKFLNYALLRNLYIILLIFSKVRLQKQIVILLQYDVWGRRVIFTVLSAMYFNDKKMICITEVPFKIRDVEYGEAVFVGDLTDFKSL